jgi:hypothetical protein
MLPLGLKREENRKYWKTGPIAGGSMIFYLMGTVRGMRTMRRRFRLRK